MTKNEQDSFGDPQQLFRTWLLGPQTAMSTVNTRDEHFSLLLNHVAFWENSDSKKVEVRI